MAPKIILSTQTPPQKSKLARIALSSPEVQSLLPMWFKHLLTLPVPQEVLVHDFNSIQHAEDLNAQNPAFSTSVALLPQHAYRSRYCNILPYDYNRVRLATPSLLRDYRPEAVGGEYSDFINASFLQGPGGCTRYIATQGPMPETLSDFWQMIWEQNSRLVVMLTQEYESGRIKCHRYWPSTVGESVVVPTDNGLRIELGLASETHSMPFILREIRLALGGQEPRTITHLQFTEWPDHGTCNSGDLLTLIDEANRIQDSLELETPGPMVVHCSAGCGRTGTFCVVDTILSLLDQVREGFDLHQDWVQQIVSLFRTQRTTMVQSLAQYMLCYEAVLQRIIEAQEVRGEESIQYHRTPSKARRG
ncbi:protein-tyrosine phosphatase-like protein [Polychytrium aggregatum]|uniref:protein-tyrosine phosphatase-like protein n=1 Tax=Polychytrium aggregatum TaxID=110093 RepID=UPI0022FE70ED|nr:protein-tyrosine phosphatase-like protein [Polychytrium aggregatum]KAI9199836.1 protein-tyrosine phosphatase-like protein [Polychytrium aggregatum]